ncbi:MAG: hypothetical protein WCD47_12065 [Candidatus Sulfotelmatobacter sp.]
MDFWIVAIDHGLQLVRNANDSSKTTAQKAHLETLLRVGIPQRKVRFIAEESKQGEVTIASALANSADPKIPWTNISMTDAEREAAGITEALKHRPGHPDHDTMQTWIESRIPEDDIREDFFIARTVQHAGDAQSILMLLGDMHVDAVGEKLREMGHRVSTNHDLFPVRRWE